ncbi:MAG TPA: PAS domain-containing protein [Anaerolineaceae bacterium]|nr:PAS domain-containing protein [Anaerolineaceae bacterium]
MATKTPIWPEGKRAKSDRLQQYRLLFEKSPQFVIFISLLRDADGQIQDWKIEEFNPALEKILDGMLDRLIDVPASQYYQDSADLVFLRDLINEVVATGQPREVERHLDTLDRTILFTLQPLGEDQLMATGVDITEQKQLIQTVEENRRQLEFITAAAQVGLWDWDLIGETLTWNEQCKRLFGLPLDAAVSYEMFLGTLHPQDRPRVEQSVQAAIERGDEYDVEFRVIWADNSVRWIHAKGQAFHTAGGQPAQLSGVAIDVTRRRQAEIEQEKVAAVHQLQNELLDQLLKEAPVGIAMLQGPEHVFVLANPAYRRLIDRELDPVGKTAVEIWPEAAELVEEILNRVFHSGILEHGVEVPMPVRRAGRLTVVYLTYTVTPYFNAAREVEGTVVLVHDMTAQVLARKQIDLEQSRLEAFVSNAPVGIVLVDEEGRMVRANPVAEQLFEAGIPFGQAYERLNVLGFHWPDGTRVNPRELPLIRSALDGETFKSIELRLERPGQIITVLGSSVPVFNPEGKISGAVGVFQDITERRQAVEDRLRAVAQIEIQHYLVQSREKERLQIAHHLHEGLLQDLIGLQFSIEEALEVKAEEARQERMHAIRRTLTNHIRELRDYCYELRPPALAPFGLEKAIRSHVDSIREKHPELQVHLDILPDMQFLPETIRLALFRVYQEVINNAIRHSGARDVWIRFVFNNREAQLEIRDNGAGFRVPMTWIEAVRNGRLGLAAAQERVESVGGQIEVLSSLNEGTTVNVSVPLTPP